MVKPVFFCERYDEAVMDSEDGRVPFNELPNDVFAHLGINIHQTQASTTAFTSSSNEMDDIRAGSVASIFRPVTTVVIGGLAAFSVAIGGLYLFPKSRQLD